MEVEGRGHWVEVEGRGHWVESTSVRGGWY